MVDLQADNAYIACIDYMHRQAMQYTLRNVPPELDKALRERAQREGRSLNDITLEALSRDAGLSGDQLKRRDLSSFSGTWIDDPDVDKALADQRAIDESMWE